MDLSEIKGRDFCLCKSAPLEFGNGFGNALWLLAQDVGQKIAPPAGADTADFLLARSKQNGPAPVLSVLGSDCRQVLFVFPSIMVLEGPCLMEWRAWASSRSQMLLFSFLPRKGRLKLFSKPCRAPEICLRTHPKTVPPPLDCETAVWAITPDCLCVPHTGPSSPTAPSATGRP